MLLFCEDNLELILAHLELLVLLSCLLFHLDKTLAVEIHAVSLRFFEFLAHGIIHRAMTGALRYGVRVRLHLLLQLVYHIVTLLTLLNHDLKFLLVKLLSNLIRDSLLF